VSKKRVPRRCRRWDFALDEIQQARLAPIVNFKGVAPRRQRRNAPTQFERIHQLERNGKVGE
jgi:hypothetical protein